MTTNSPAADEARIREMIDDWADALRAKDAERVIAHQVDGFVQYSLAPPLLSPMVDADGLNAWFETWDGPLAITIRDLSLAVAGDVAFGHCLSRLSGTKVGGEHDELWFRQTFGFRRVDGVWKLAHQHESVPFYMDGSDRAAIDLAPADEAVVA